jgi:hypothetical protein
VKVIENGLILNTFKHTDMQAEQVDLNAGEAVDHHAPGKIVDDISAKVIEILINSKHLNMLICRLTKVT